MIHIIGDYYAKPNNMGFTVLKKKGLNKKGQQTYLTVGYCGNMSEVCWLVYQAAVGDRLQERDTELKEAIEIMKETRDMIYKQLEVLE